MPAEHPDAPQPRPTVLDQPAVASHCEGRGPPSIQLPISDDELRARHTAGTTVTELVRTYLVSRTTIWRHLNTQFTKSTATTEAALRPEYGGRPATPHSDQAWRDSLPSPELGQRYQTGETIVSIASSLNIPAATLYKRLKRHTTIRPPRPAADIRADGAELHAAHQAGVSLKRLAQAFGGTDTSIRRRINLRREA